MTKKRKKLGKRPVRSAQKSILLFHDMRVEEDFELCAQRMFEVVRGAARRFPGRPRRMILTVQGHRNDLGAFDHDAFEIMQEFGSGFLLCYLTEFTHPYFTLKNNRKQREDIPDVLEITPPEDGSGSSFDYWGFARRQREFISDPRSSRPTLRAIADYLGRDTSCQICWRKPVERAHAVPESLGGSNDVRNFALLCTYHHREAPDIADAEAFWRWIDYVYDRDAHMRPEVGIPGFVFEASPWNELIGVDDEGKPGTETDENLFRRKLRIELTHLYGWGPEEFSRLESIGIDQEFHRVRRGATGRHRGVGRKVSTYAWAYNTALVRFREIEKIKEERASEK
ncbi:hypothetical protein DFP74_5469 [Nocardiopsis sp. Huas11]|uniref:HNH endonuclease signature motif containing protein n=1 Tax=Nocardiopsis sp. Huas11 TaxID=2183912 RepID=UPI000F2667F6|nr:HNH endonuclease signature motif containing protein [Nocardiopsis sp. Huas11]RKS09727.1 hypothetical protein DFP74_5469 [Nocardiopsis sp. Huas11]